MTWSLELRNGDLTLGEAAFGTVTGEAKLVQDLRAYILERIGTDDAHPSFGSLLDGGRLSDGTAVAGIIGQPNTELAQLEVESEIRRLATEYQNRQLARAKDDRITYGKTSLTRSEVLLGIREIDLEQDLDSLNLTVHLETAAKSTIALDIALQI